MNISELREHLSDRKTSAKPAGRIRLNEGENRFAAILFADVHGFTNLSEKLDPETVHALLDQLMIGFTERVSKYRGYVDKYEGDRIMAHFGSTNYLEQNSRRAILAGLDMIEVVSRLNRLLPEIDELRGIATELSIRVGIDSGLVTTGKVGLKREGDFTTYGDNVNIASRMESMGELNRVMVPEWVKQDLEKYFYFDFHGCLEVKGKIEPISTYLVSGINRLRKNRIVSHSKFVGRTKELRILRKLVERNRPACTGKTDLRVEVAALVASAGMGKTRLSREFLRTLNTGCCYRAEISPFEQSHHGLFKALLRDILGIESEPDSDAGIIRQRLRELFTNSENDETSTVMDDLLALLGYADAEPEDHRLNQSLAILFRTLANKARSLGSSLVVFLDDLHWADEASLNTLDFLIRELKSAGDTPRVVFILAYREGFIPSGTILHQSSFTELRLRELTAAELQRFLHCLLPGHQIPAGFEKVLLTKSSGNPLYLEEWAESLRVRLQSGEAPDWSSLEPPSSIVPLVLSRLDQFPKATVRVLKDASVIGTRFSRDILGEVESRLEEGVEPDSHLGALGEARLLIREEPNEYLFKHQLTRDAVYGTLLKSNRRILHGLVAELLETQCGGNPADGGFQIAHHYDCAGNAPKAIHYLKMAERVAHRHFMNKRSLQLCDRILALGTPEDRIEAMMRKAAVYLDTGEYELARKALVKIPIANTSDPLLRDRYILCRVRLLQVTGTLRQAVNYLTQHLETLQLDSSRNTAGIQLLDLRRLMHDETGFEDEATRLFDRLNDSPTQQGRLLNILGLYYNQKSDYTRAVECYHQALELAGNNRALLRFIHHNLANVAARVGHADEAITHYHKALTIGRILDDVGGCGKVLGDLATFYLSRGETAKALSMMEECLEITRVTGNRKQEGLVSYNLAVQYYHLNEYDKARELLRQSIRVCEELEDVAGLGYAYDLLGDIFFQEGMLAQARKVYAGNLTRQKAIGDKDGVAHTYGNLGNIATQIGEYGKAEGYYRQQQQILTGIGDRDGEARMLYDWALLDAARDDLPAALLKLEQSHSIFTELGDGLYLETVNNAIEYYREQMEQDPTPVNPD
jgi:class 3 adenylate cyclase/tetratricopeptide (TPR) repeat protein